MTYPSPVNATRISQLLQYTNEVTNNWFGNLVILAIFVIVFLAMLNRPVKEAFAAASFITLLLASFLYLMQILNELVLFICIFATAIGVIGLLRDK